MGRLTAVIKELVNIADDDLFYAVDVSDPTDNIEGSSARARADTLRAYAIATLGSAALLDTGILDGEIPVIDVGDKLLTSLIDTGVLNGQIPIIGAGDKVPNSIINKATEILEGIREISSQLEANDETNDVTFLTPKKMHDAILGFDLLLEQVASSSTSIEFINLPITDYSSFYILVGGVTPSNNAVNFSVRLSNDNGVTWNQGATDYRYALNGRHTDGGNTTDDDNADTQMIFNDNGGGNQVGNQATSSYNASLLFYDLDSTSKVKHVSCNANYDCNTANRTAVIQATGVFSGNTLAVNGIQIFFNAGTISNGTFKLYGIK